MMSSFRINRVYTRAGDKGSTALADGKRVLKCSKRVEAYGTIDELNSSIGFVKEKIPPSAVDAVMCLESIQQELFDIGAELSAGSKPPKDRSRCMQYSAVVSLESMCDRFGEALPELTSFVIPGGSEAAALFHIVRSSARRAERKIVALANASGEWVNPEIICYMNRLSDLLFIMARWVLQEQRRPEQLWIPTDKR